MRRHIIFFFRLSVQAAAADENQKLNMRLEKKDTLRFSKFWYGCVPDTVSYPAIPLAKMVAFLPQERSVGNTPGGRGVKPSACICYREYEKSVSLQTT